MLSLIDRDKPPSQLVPSCPSGVLGALAGTAGPSGSGGAKEILQLGDTLSGFLMIYDAQLSENKASSGSDMRFL